MSQILVVTSVPTLPADAGNRARIKTMLDALESAGHTIVIVHALREPGDVSAMQARWGHAYIPVNYSEPKRFMGKRRRRLSKKLGLERAYTYGLDDWYDPVLDEHIRLAVRTWDIDVVLAEYIFFSRALEAVPDTVVKMLDTHDRFSNRHQRFLQAGLEPAWFSCTPAEEQRGIQRADIVLAIQDKEADYFKTLTDKTVVTVGHLVELADEPCSEPAGQSVLIVGSANTINVDSTQWYLDKVWPRVAAELPEAELRIAGGVCSELNISDSAPASIKLLGRVDELADEYSKAQLVVNPMLTGTGLKIKTIEAMGACKAVISTASGAEGLESAVPTALIKSSNEQTMIAHTLELLKQPGRCAELGRAARTYAQNYNTACLTNFNAALTRG